MVTHQVNGMKYEKTPVRLSINRKKVAYMQNDITKKTTRDILWFLYKRHGTVVWQSVAGMLGVLLIVSWVS